MSVLDQDSQRRILALLSAPPTPWKDIAAAFERGANVEWRYANPQTLHYALDGTRSIQRTPDSRNPWREHVRYLGYDPRLGGYATCTPNWHNEDLEFQLAPGYVWDANQQVVIYADPTTGRTGVMRKVYSKFGHARFGIEAYPASEGDSRTLQFADSITLEVPNRQSSVVEDFDKVTGKRVIWGQGETVYVTDWMLAEEDRVPVRGTPDTLFLVPDSIRYEAPWKFNIL